MGLPAVVVIAMSETEIQSEAQFENASAEDQIQYDIQNGEWYRVRERDYVDKIAEVVAEYDSEPHKVQVFDTPAGWFYVSENQAELYFDLSDDKPYAVDMVQDSIAHIKHIVSDGVSKDDAYTVNGDSELASEVAERIQDRLDS
jgi:hypothetical protein